MRVLSILLIAVALFVTGYFLEHSDSAIHQVFAVSIGAAILILARMAQAEAIWESQKELMKPKE